LAVSELLAGIKDEETFNKRKGIIRMLFFSKIPIDLDYPEAKRFKAFGITFESDIPNRIILIGQLCIACKSFTEFQSQISHYHLKEHWDFLKKYDNPHSEFKKALKLRQENFGYEDPNMIPNFRDRWDNISKNKEFRDRVVNQIIIYFAKLILENNLIKTDGKKMKELLDSYDFSLEFFFICVAYFTGSKLVFKNEPARNDFIDLAHLTYLRNPDDVIITNDRMLIQLLGKFCPHNVISADDFAVITFQYR
jgi:hypothetical protein